MKRPLPAGTPIDARRFRRWIDAFPGYHSAVAAVTLEAWLGQFKSKDRDLAARILDATIYMTSGEIRAIYRDLLSKMEGWHRQKSRRTGNWFFVPFSGSVGESGDSMTHIFRMATNMSNRFFKPLFIHRSELLIKMPGPEDTVVLIDDFAGTGNQACSSWSRFFQEMFPGSPHIFLMLVGATAAAIQKIGESTEMQPICGKVFGSRDNLFDLSCNKFTREEKKIVIRYCRRADRQFPRGYGNSGLLVVLSHQCPNNSLPILHSVNTRWDGLFPRK